MRAKRSLLRSLSLKDSVHERSCLVSAVLISAESPFDVFFLHYVVGWRSIWRSPASHMLLPPNGWLISAAAVLIPRPVQSLIICSYRAAFSLFSTSTSGRNVRFHARGRLWRPRERRTLATARQPAGHPCNVARTLRSLRNWNNRAISAAQSPPHTRFRQASQAAYHVKLDG
ncbi:hypothetical protein CC78DRAFT_575310 [Lojkania enalia]|uniref:Uncharacterized protein n=1 Tax=Lojkania enalia TaxID=147567 RepID=A0A9P4N9R4_9PLEO|nr:hypothetical protein CC78DRAFT_575310 [Didymosphaeria enalia]